MTGHKVTCAATEHPDLIDAVVDFSGIFNPAITADLKKLRAPVQAHFGEHDPSCLREKIDARMAGVAAAGVEYELHAYETGHAFFNDSRPTACNEAAATLAWTRSIALVQRALG